jgi:hypothetical protein
MASRCEPCLLGRCNGGARPSRCEDRLACACCGVVAPTPSRRARRQAPKPVMAGSVASRARPRRHGSGRRHWNPVTPEQLQRTLELRAAGATWRQVAEAVGRDHSALRNHLLRKGLQDPGPRKPPPPFGRRVGVRRALRELIGAVEQTHPSGDLAVALEQAKAALDRRQEGAAA